MFKVIQINILSHFYVYSASIRAANINSRQMMNRL